MGTKISKTITNVKEKVDETTASISSTVKEKNLERKEKNQVKKAERKEKNQENKAERIEKKQEKKLSKEEQDNLLVTLIGQAVKIPMVKVNRENFLRDCFKDFPSDQVNEIIEKGPVEFGISKEVLKRKANTLIAERTALSAGISFAAGIPGGIAMAAAIPADLLQFYAMSLRLAQELAYLYGEEDIFEKGTVDSEKVRNQMILYVGVMMGSNGAIKTVQMLASNLAAQALKKIPQKALTKTFYYPIIKSICKAFGVAVTKESFAKGVSKIIPIAGGVVSGAITLASMIPMAKRLVKTLEKAKFEYTQEEFEQDWKEITELAEKGDSENAEVISEMEKEFEETLIEQEQIDREEIETIKTSEKAVQVESVLKQIKEAKEMLDAGILTEEEFNKLKAELIK